MDLGPALQVMIQFTVISTIAMFAIETLVAVLSSPGKLDDLKAVITLGIAFFWDLDFVTVCAGNEPVYAVGAQIGMAITGIAMAGNPATLIARIKKNVSDVKAA